MKFATFIVVALAIAVLLVSFMPQNSEASKKKLLKKAKKRVERSFVKLTGWYTL